MYIFVIFFLSGKFFFVDMVCCCVLFVDVEDVFCVVVVCIVMVVGDLIFRLDKDLVSGERRIFFFMKFILEGLDEFDLCEFFLVLVLFV